MGFLPFHRSPKKQTSTRCARSPLPRTSQCLYQGTAAVDASPLRSSFPRESHRKAIGKPCRFADFKFFHIP